MGEGQPGVALDRSFYDAARALTKENHSLLIIDSIQAALRAKGTLSVVDYPGYPHRGIASLALISAVDDVGML